MGIRKNVKSVLLCRLDAIDLLPEQEVWLVFWKLPDPSRSSAQTLETLGTWVACRRRGPLVWKETLLVKGCAPVNCYRSGAAHLFSTRLLCFKGRFLRNKWVLYFVAYKLCHQIIFRHRIGDLEIAQLVHLQKKMLLLLFRHLLSMRAPISSTLWHVPLCLTSSQQTESNVGIITSKAHGRLVWLFLCCRFWPKFDLQNK